MLRLSSCVAISLLATFVMSGSAFAHAHLKSAVPPVAGKVATSPKELDLHFSEGLNLRFTGIVLKGPKGAVIKTREAALKHGDDRTLLVPLSRPLTAGRYDVSWHALSKDGHKTKGSYHFTVTTK